MGLFDSVKEGAEVIGSKVTIAAKTVTVKTGEAVGNAKIRSKINSEKKAIDVVKKEIGDLLWTKYLNGETVDSDIAALCEIIRDHNGEIDKLEEQLIETGDN